MGREELYSADVEQKALVLSGKDPKEPGARLEPDSGIAAAPTDPGTMQNFKLTLVSPPGRDGVIVRYEGISGNRPKCYANSVALWDNWYPDPTKDEPLNVTPVPSNRQPDSVPIDYTKFQGTDYLVTYQVGAALTSMCASLRLSPRIGEVAEPPSSVLISL